MHRWLASLGVVLAVGATSGLAHASSPLGAYARVQKVVYEPDAASATRARIYGVFALWDPSTGTSWSYGAPQGGYMYFECPAGQETTCRKEWSELAANASSPSDCIGFGQMNVAPGRVRPTSEAPAKPDVYPIAVGTVSTAYAGGTCEKIRAYVAPGDAGVPDSGSTDTGTPAADTGVAVDSGVAADTGTSPVDTGTAAVDTGTPSAPAAAPPADSGCSVGGGGVGSVGSVGLLGFVLVGLLRRRERAS